MNAPLMGVAIFFSSKNEFAGAPDNRQRLRGCYEAQKNRAIHLVPYMRIVAAVAAFAAGCFHHQQALRGEPAVNFGGKRMRRFSGCGSQHRHLYWADRNHR